VSNESKIERLSEMKRGKSNPGGDAANASPLPAGAEPETNFTKQEVHDGLVG